MADTNNLNWPKSGMKLFNEGNVGEGFKLPECKKRGGKTYRMPYPPEHPDAFKLAGDLVLHAYLDGAVLGHHDELIFPVAYLYRHAIEMKLKEIVRHGLDLRWIKGSETLRKFLGTGHDLDRLWGKARCLISKRYEGCDPEPIEATADMIAELHQVDPNGQTLRYGTDTHGMPYEYDELPEWVDIKSFHENFDALYTFLSATEGGLAEAVAEQRTAQRDNAW